MKLRHDRVRISALTLVLAALLACGDDSTNDGGTDGSADATTQDVATQDVATQDVVAKDVVVQDATGPDGAVPDASPSDGGAVDAAADGGPAFECTSTGGTVAMGLCCNNTSDFPSTCTTGPCGCSPQNSHTVQTCQCPMNKCYTQQQGCH